MGLEISSVYPREEELVTTPAGWEPSPKALTTGVLRSLNLSTIVEETKRSQASFLDWWANIDPARRRQLERRAAELREMAPARRGRPPIHMPEHWMSVAAVADGAAREGLISPTAAVKKFFTVNPSTANKWIKKARSLGFPIGEEKQ